MKAARRGVLPLLLVILSAQASKITDETVARTWLDEYNVRSQVVIYESAEAAWNYNTNLTDYNQNAQGEANLKKSLFRKEVAKNTTLFDWRNFKNADIKRQFSKLAVAGTANLPVEEVTKVDKLRAQMQKIYSTAEVPNKPNDPSGRSYPLNPDLTEILASSRDWDTLAWAWKGWRDQTGKKMKAMYPEFVSLQNKAAKGDGFTDSGDYWRSWYEMTNLESEIERLWMQVKPLYQQLHAYVRRELMGVYKGRNFPSSRHIPAHILGNMWAQSWSNIESEVRPYPNKEVIDVTGQLKAQNYTVERLFELSEEFFTSIGLMAMPEEFWNKSMIRKPTDRKVVCHASAWDFYNQKDFRIKQCTEITMEWLVTTHHEMGHVQYFLQYKDQPAVHRRGANPGFHEAVGDVMSLSVSTPEHLKEIKLLDKVENDTDADINYLMSQALKKISFLPFGYLIDQWRWRVFSGQIHPADYNSQWWRLRCKHQGIAPPTTRSEADFDPGAKYHIPGNTPYIRYFVSYILQFQIQKSLCDTAGNRRPLHRCDIYRSKEAGQKLGKMLKLGSSKLWPDALEQVAGSRTMDAGPLLEYFRPLHDWLKIQNEGKEVGWDNKCPDGINLGPSSSGILVTSSMALTLVASLAFIARQFW